MAKIGKPCPNCDAVSYGDSPSICRAKAGNLVCRTCGETFEEGPSHEFDICYNSEVSLRVTVEEKEDYYEATVRHPMQDMDEYSVSIGQSWYFFEEIVDDDREKKYRANTLKTLLDVVSGALCHGILHFVPDSVDPYEEFRRNVYLGYRLGIYKSQWQAQYDLRQS